MQAVRARDELQAMRARDELQAARVREASRLRVAPSVLNTGRLPLLIPTRPKAAKGKVKNEEVRVPPSCVALSI